MEREEEKQIEKEANELIEEMENDIAMLHEATEDDEGLNNVVKGLRARMNNLMEYIEVLRENLENAMRGK